jgi:hypothetical protein
MFNSGEWVSGEFIDIRPGTIFRMFEDTEKTELVGTYESQSFPYIITNEDGTLSLRVDFIDWNKE